MRKRILHFLNKSYLPRWIILLTDLVIVSVSFIILYQYRFNLFLYYADVPRMMFQLAAGLPLFILGAAIFKPHHGILRQSGLQDAVAVFFTLLFFSGGLSIISVIGKIFYSPLDIPYSVILVHFFMSVFALVFMRFMIRHFYVIMVKRERILVKVMIYGTGTMGTTAYRVIANDDEMGYYVIGFIDENKGLWGKRISGIDVYSPEVAFKKIIPGKNVKELLLAVPPGNMTPERKNEIVDMCIADGIKIKEIPDPSTWFEGRFNTHQIRNLQIEDLLFRNPIKIDRDLLCGSISGKRVMVTGGAGSIGSEIARQLIDLEPESIIIVDQNESALVEIKDEITNLKGNIILQTYVADVVNHFKMRKIFRKTSPQIIFHAAAYKHVPVMELQPMEAISNNVGGTKNLADLAVEFNVEKFVMISTDKAVNPTNIMGASKRICEIYIQSVSQRNDLKTQFITTRFGNVLGSNGSVVPLFQKQIRQGGPVTITHHDIIRYFMTISEACQLVLKAANMGIGGEIFVFDMGKPVKIYELAEKMIILSGYKPGTDIEIVETGLRPGEKLYEELLVIEEETLPTGYEKIMAARIRPYDYAGSLIKINELLEQLTTENDMKLVTRMKEIVPEFISNNSKFEVLDTVMHCK